MHWPFKAEEASACSVFTLTLKTGASGHALLNSADKTNENRKLETLLTEVTMK
jgi:hypothetical protein